MKQIAVLMSFVGMLTLGACAGGDSEKPFSLRDPKGYKACIEYSLRGTDLDFIGVLEMEETVARLARESSIRDIKKTVRSLDLDRQAFQVACDAEFAK